MKAFLVVNALHYAGKGLLQSEVRELDWALLKKITGRILAEVPGICRVCYDLTPKPIGTVEWE